MKSDKEYRQLAEAQWRESHEQVSDVYETQDENGDYTIPMVEWDGPWGRRRARYESFMARAAALDQHSYNAEEWIQNSVDSMKRAAELVDQVHNGPTLGDAFPDLKKKLFGES